MATTSRTVVECWCFRDMCGIKICEFCEHPPRAPLIGDVWSVCEIHGAMCVSFVVVCVLQVVCYCVRQ